MLAEMLEMSFVRRLVLRMRDAVAVLGLERGVVGPQHGVLRLEFRIGHLLSEGLRPSDSPTRSLARRSRRRAPFAWLARALARAADGGQPPLELPDTLARAGPDAPLRSRGSLATLVRAAGGGQPPLELPDTLARGGPDAPLRSRGSLATLARAAGGGQPPLELPDTVPPPLKLRRDVAEAPAARRRAVRVGRSRRRSTGFSDRFISSPDDVGRSFQG